MNLSPHTNAINRWRHPSAWAAVFTVILLVLNGPLYAQDEGNATARQLSGPNGGDVAGAESIRAEFEAGLSADYPEEFAIYNKLDSTAQAEILAEFKRFADKPDNYRYPKAINRLGLISGAGGWGY